MFITIIPRVCVVAVLVPIIIIRPLSSDRVEWGLAHGMTDGRCTIISEKEEHRFDLWL